MGASPLSLWREMEASSKRWSLLSSWLQSACLQITADLAVHRSRSGDPRGVHELPFINTTFPLQRDGFLLAVRSLCSSSLPG